MTLLPRCYSSVTLLQPHISLFSSSNTSSLFKAQAIWTCCAFCREYLLLHFLTFITSDSTFSERLPLAYLSKRILPSHAHCPVILCQATLLRYHNIWHFLILSCLSVTSLSSVFPQLKATFMRTRTRSLLFPSTSPAPRIYLVHKIHESNI